MGSLPGLHRARHATGGGPHPRGARRDTHPGRGRHCPLVDADPAQPLREGVPGPGGEGGLRRRYAWQDLPGTAQAFILKGYDNPVYVHFRNRFGRNRTYTQKYEGILPYVRRRFDEAETDAARDRWGGYLREIPCSTCHGARLKPRRWR